MKFQSTQLTEVFIVEEEPRGDERGFFSRVYCEEEFRDAGLHFSPIQMNRSLSINPLTLRGMHYQINNSAEDKYVRAVRGSIFDVALDIRPHSKTYLNWVGVRLTSDNNLGLFIPKGFAHGMLTLEPNTLIEYLVSAPFSSTDERGIRWDDPKIKIEWPQKPSVISKKDLEWLRLE